MGRKAKMPENENLEEIEAPEIDPGELPDGVEEPPKVTPELAATYERR